MKGHYSNHNIKTDISVPYTPEQNGVDKAANKVIPHRTRSFLFNSGMLLCFWPWVVEHSYYIANWFSCLTTKLVPLIDLLKGLRQLYEEKIDINLLPRFYYRIYKYVAPNQ